MEWIGKLRKGEDGVTSYRSCSFNGEIFSTNDDVMVKGERGKLYICTISKLYNDPSNEEPNRAKVRWYFNYNELPQKCKRVFKKSLPHEKELFKAIMEDDGSCFPGVVEEIDAETIESTSIIKIIDANDQPPLSLNSNEYFVRYGFRKTGELCNVKDDLKNRTCGPKIDNKNVGNLSAQIQPLKGTRGKRKASRSIAGEGVGASKRNKSSIKKTDTTTGTRKKAFSSEEALEKVLNDNDSDGANSLDEESSSGAGKKDRKALQYEGGEMGKNKGPQASPSHQLSGKKPHLSNLITDALKIKQVQVSRRRGHDAKNRGKTEVAKVSKGQKDGDYCPSQSDSDSVDSDTGTESEELDNDTETKGSLKKGRSSRTTGHANKATSSRKNQSISKTPMKTPRRSIGRKFMTPSICERSIPCKTPKTPLERARQRLHVSSVPDSLPCREEEFAEIYAFIEGKLTSDLGGLHCTFSTPRCIQCKTHAGGTPEAPKVFLQQH